jgi:hypothetical protein
MNLIEAYQKADELISNEVTNWLEIDLGDLVFSELMTSFLSPSRELKYSTKDKIRLWLTSFKIKIKIREIESNSSIIFFFINSKSQWKNAKQVIKELINRKLCPVIITTKPKLTILFEELAVPVRLVQGYDIFARLPVYISSIQLRKFVNFYFPKISYTKRMFANLITKFEPTYAFIGNDNTLEGRLFARVCNLKGIETGSLQHGLLNRINPLHGRSVVKNFYLYGIKAKTELLFLKNKSNLKIVGNPQIFKPKEDYKFREFNYNPFVLLALSGIGYGASERQFKRTVDWVYKVQQEYRLNICIKLHAKDVAQNYTQFNTQNTLILNDHDMANLGLEFFDLIASSKFMITGASASALEGLALGKHVVSLDPEKNYCEIDFIMDELVCYANNEAQLYIIIEKLMGKKESIDKINEGIENYFYNCLEKNYNPAQKIASAVISSIG